MHEGIKAFAVAALAVVVGIVAYEMITSALGGSGQIA